MMTSTCLCSRPTSRLQKPAQFWTSPQSPSGHARPPPFVPHANSATSIVPARQDSPEQEWAGDVRGHDLDPHPGQLCLDELQDRRTLRRPGRREEAQAEALPVADVDAVGATAAARLLEQAPRPSRVEAVAAPAWPVLALGGEEDRAVERAAVTDSRLAQHHARDLHAVDAERQCPAHEPVPQGGVPAGVDAEGQVLHARRGPGEGAPAGQPTNQSRSSAVKIALPAVREMSISLRPKGPNRSSAPWKRVTIRSR